MLGPTLETARLILRPSTQDDFEGFAAMAAEEDTMRFIGGVAPRDGAWRSMATLTGAWALLGYSMFSVIEKETGEWIGRLGPWRPGGVEGNWPGYEIGWGLKRAAQGRGLAHEGAVAAMDWAFDHLGWEDVIHCIAAENAPSIKLAEKLGSHWLRQDRLGPPFDVPIEIYGQTRAEWRARKS
jgi:RimJ/RimL family protein N-acetyltransferase